MCIRDSILTGYMPATSGTARVAGFDVFRESMEVRRRIGYLPENPPLYPDMTVETYLDFVARIKNVPAERRPARIDDALRKTNLEAVSYTHLDVYKRQGAISARD